MSSIIEVQSLHENSSKCIPREKSNKSHLYFIANAISDYLWECKDLTKHVSWSQYQKYFWFDVARPLVDVNDTHTKFSSSIVINSPGCYSEYLSISIAPTCLWCKIHFSNSTAVPETLERSNHNSQSGSIRILKRRDGNKIMLKFHENKPTKDSPKCI